MNPQGGHRTAYLWEQVWERESWLEILGRYIIAQRNKKKQIEKVIFPRFHQLDVTRKLQAAVLAEGAGGKYLVQHSAGSGKTNSIAWTAHFLAELHDGQNQKLFDTVLVVSDRNVIDAQLQEALFDFERTSGVVATIKGTSDSKSKELAAALDGSKKIVVCTIQTFPFALEAVRKLAAAQGKRFAVIADEAHSSQTGEAAAKLKAVLSPEELADLEDGGEVSTEDILAAQMAARADDNGISFVAFTATPKNKTLEIFGTRPDPTRKPAPDNIPAPFHVYSMRQAIEEKFILDVLQNYTPYKLAFKLAHEGGKGCDDMEVERSAAMKGIMGWVRLHPYNIAQKVGIVVEHFRRCVAPLLDGHAKAMVVVGSRVEAVRWQFAIDAYIKSEGYQYKRLLPLLEFGREREGIDLSKVALTHHHLINLGRCAMPLGEGETPKLDPITEAGSGSVQEQYKVYMAELIEKLNALFGADTTDQDQLVYVNHVIKGKLIESETLMQQAANNSKEQFANSPDLSQELMSAIMGALDAHNSMSAQALNSPAVQRGIKDILLNHSRLYETLRAQQTTAAAEE